MPVGITLLPVITTKDTTPGSSYDYLVAYDTESGVSNILSERGSTFLINPDLPLGQIMSINSITIDASGEDDNFWFDKYFSIRENGGNWSSPAPLIELPSYPINPDSHYEVRFRLDWAADNQHADTFHELTFNSILIEGDRDPDSSHCGPIYDQSIFGQWFNCEANLEWCLNVANKMYEEGIVPNYIERNKGGDDTDYQNFWQAIACFFGVLVKFGRNISEFDNDLTLLKDFLRARTLFFCEAENISISIYQQLAEDYLSIIQKRGSWGMLEELKTYICHSSAVDEFIFNLRPNKYFGWNLNNSSPIVKSIAHQLTLNKSYEPDGGFTDLNLYPTSGSPTISGGNCILQPADSIGYLVGGSIAVADTIKISPYINYAISFDVKAISKGAKVTFGVHTSDNNRPLPNAIVTKNINTGLDDSIFIDDFELLQGDVWYNIVGILFTYQKDIDINAIGPNLGVGNNLRMRNEDVGRLMPYITCGDSDSLEIRNLQIKPASMPYSTGFIQASNFIDFLFVNRNYKLLWNETQQRFPELYDNMKKFLLPYNTLLKDTHLRRDLLYIGDGEIPPLGAPVADFVGVPTTVVEGKTVQFTDLSTNTPTSWLWQFEDGNPATSTDQNPLVTFSGTKLPDKDVSLRAFNAAGDDIEEKLDYIHVIEDAQIPLADFVGVPTDILEGETVQFTDLSTNTPTEWLWAFEDGTPPTSTDQHPLITFNNGTPKLKDVTLTAGNAAGGTGAFKPDYIAVSPAPQIPIANFRGSPTTIYEGESVQFTDLSTNNPTSWAWTFEDGVPATSTEQNPLVTFNDGNPKLKDITLVVSNAAGGTGHNEDDYITVLPAPQVPIADFEGSPLSVDVDEEVQFTDLSTNNPTEWFWQFEDGVPATSTAQNPSVTFSSAGTKNVSLTAGNAAGGTGALKTDYITVNASEIPD